MILIAGMSVALNGTVEARPRLFRMLGVLAAPMGAIAGGMHARAHHSRFTEATRHRQTDEAAAPARSGPTFWPTAFDDLFGYTLGEPAAEARFWAHDYGDVLDAMFGDG